MANLKSSFTQRIISRLQSKSLTPFAFMGSCCREEIIFHLDNLSKMGFPLDSFVYNPWQADLLIVAGPINHKQIELLQRSYDQMLEPKWVMVLGACSLTGANFHNGIVSKNIAEVIPVDVLVPGCPPKLEELHEAFLRLYSKVTEGKVYES